MTTIWYEPFVINPRTEPRLTSTASGFRQPFEVGWQLSAQGVLEHRQLRVVAHDQDDLTQMSLGVTPAERVPRLVRHEPAGVELVSRPEEGLVEVAPLGGVGAPWRPG